MRLGYNTNGMAHHEIHQAIDLLAQIGYRSVALTIDHGVLSPLGGDVSGQVRTILGQLQHHGMTSVIETGARFLIDPRQKHEPTLVTADPAARQRRIAFYKYAVALAAALGSECVSLWSGTLRDEADDEAAFGRLVEGLREVLDAADANGVAIGFEPEPGMFIDTLARFEELLQRIDAPHLKLTLDVGHVHCLDECPIPEAIGRWRNRLVNVHIEDMRRGRHEHLMFGEGEIDFPPVIAALAEAQYAGGIHVELSRHSHEAPQAAQRAYEFLQPLLAAHGAD